MFYFWRRYAKTDGIFGFFDWMFRRYADEADSDEKICLLSVLSNMLENNNMHASPEMAQVMVNCIAL